MPLSPVFIIVSIVFGFAITLLLKEKLLLEERIFYGILIGFASSTWIGFIESLYFGLDTKTIIITSSVLLLSTLLILYITFFKRKHAFSYKAISQSEVLLPILILICIFLPLFYILFSRVILWKVGGLYTGLAYNLGDLPYHWSIVNSFLFGENFPPEHTLFNGYPLRYYFLSDFFTALLIKSGLSQWSAYTFQGVVLSIVLLAVIYLFTYRFTHNKIAAALSPFLFFLNGGLGFIQFFKDLIINNGALTNFLLHLKDYTNMGELGYRWINTTTSLLVPQRAFLFGFPISILALTMMWVGIEKRSRAHFAFGGFIAGMLPLFHAHSSLSLGMISSVLFLIFPSVLWLWFFVPAGVLSIPQALYLMPR